MKTCFRHMRNNKGAFVHYLDNIIPILAKSKISRLYLVSVAEQAGLSLTLLETPKTGFVVTRLKFYMVYIMILSFRTDWPSQTT